MLTTRFWPAIGGAETHVYQLSSELNALGNRVVVIAELFPKNVPSLEETRGFRVYRAPVRQVGFLLFPIYFALSISVCARFKPDIVHAHFALPSGAVALALSRLFHKRFVITLHGIDILKDKQTGYGLRLNPILDSMTRWVLRLATHIMAVSEFVKKEAIRCGADAKTITVIGNGIDRIDERIAVGNADKMKFRLELNLPRNGIVLLAARRLVPKNGLGLLIDAMRQVVEKDPRFLLLIAGDGPERRKLLEMVRCFNLSQKVIFWGEVGDEKLEKLYGACDFAVLPSLVEAFGLPTLEAMAYLRPILAFDSGGPREIVGKNKTGIIVENRNATQLARAILKLADDSKLVQNIRERCMKMVHHYAWRNIGIRVLEVYSKAIAK